MKYFFAVLLLCYAATAAPANEESIQAAQFNPYSFNYYQQPMYNKPMFDSQFSMNFASPERYLSMKNEDFPTDYSLSCSNTCGCRQACAVMFWMPCTCRCPPLCGCVGCIWGCCGQICCEETTTVTTVTEETTTEEETTPTIKDDDEETTTPKCNGGGNCCGGCSCSPCMIQIWWMCPPKCGSSCCGGSSSCCNGSNNSCCGK